MDKLLPNSAELKLLRSAQMRVNRRTQAFDQARPAEGGVDDLLRGELAKIAALQEEIAALTLEMIER
jgi:hypothetical protein